jgi:serine/threonine-protein kinase
MGELARLSAGGGGRRVVDRYIIGDEIASGGMATVHVGRLVGQIGFVRTVAIKRLHRNLAKDPEFVSMLMDEARLAARIRHPNVVATIDVVSRDGELLLVLEYVIGDSLGKLVRAARTVDPSGRVPLPIALSIAHGMLCGLHAAHEATTEDGAPMGIVHRDVSPQNVLVGTDGVARVIDFGVAKAAERVHSTSGGQLKGKLGYMSPEQVRGEPIDRRCDVFAAAIVLWELASGRRLFTAKEPGAALDEILNGIVLAPSAYEPAVTPTLDEVILHGLELDKDRRFATCRDFAVALESACPMANAREVGEWVERVASETLKTRAARVKEAESLPSSSHPSISTVQPVTAVAPGRAEPPIERPRRLWPIALSGVTAIALGSAAAVWVVHARSEASTSLDDPHAATEQGSATPSAPTTTPTAVDSAPPPTDTSDTPPQAPASSPPASGIRPPTPPIAKPRPAPWVAPPRPPRPAASGDSLFDGRK